MRTTSPTEIYRVQQLERNLVFFMQQKILFSYNFDALLHIISQINFSLDFEKYKFLLTSDER